MNNDILARLRNGEDVDAIAKELIDALNEANAAFQKEEEEKARLAEAKAIQEEREAIKREDMRTFAQMIVDLVHDYFETADPELFKKLIPNDTGCEEFITAKDIEDILDGVIKGLRFTYKMDAVPHQIDLADVIFNDFFKSLSLR